MYRIFSKNSPLAYALLLVLLLVFRIELFSSPYVATLGADADLYTPVWHATFGGIMAGSALWITLAVAVQLITVYAINNLTNTFRFTQMPTNLGGMFYVLLSSGFLISQGLHPVHVFALMQVFALYQLFKGAREGVDPSFHCFNAAFMLAVGAMFWAKGIWFWFFLVLFCGRIKTLTRNTFLCLLLGLMCPFVMWGLVALLKGDLADLYHFVQLTAVPVSFLKTPALSVIFIVIYGALMLFSILGAFGVVSSLGIFESRIISCAIWHTLGGALCMLLPIFSYEMQILIALGGAMLMAGWCQRMRNERLKEGITSGFALMALIVQLV